METPDELVAPVVEVFRSLEGEGFFVGAPTIFVRLAGCNVGCKHCDSKGTWKTEGVPTQSVEEVVETIRCLREKTKIPRVSITGGEPLIHLEFILRLCDELMMDKDFYTIN